MTTGLRSWSKTAASNNSADSAVNWAEGQAPSSVNNSARAEMASAAKFRDDNSGTLLTSGSTTAYTVTSNQVSTSYLDGDTIAVTFHAANDSSATLSLDGVTAAPLQLISGTNLSGGEFQAGASARFHYSSSSTAWVAQGMAPAGTNNLANGAVTYAKIQNESVGTILGNGSTAAAAPSEITVGAGLNLSATTISAPAFPHTGSFKNLSIKTATTTTVNGIADFVTLATSGSTFFVTLPASGTINFATNGAANTLDTGTLTNSTFYSIWAIASTTSTHADLIASTSLTTPLLPSGYTIKGRIGWQVTTTTTATPALHGIYQFGREAQYVNGVGGTTKITSITTSSGGDVTVPTWVTASTTAYVPQTASEIKLSLRIVASGNVNSQMAVAPSTSYGGVTSSNNFPPVIAQGISGAANCAPCVQARLALETSNIYYASTDLGNVIGVLGWTDNL